MVCSNKWGAVMFAYLQVICLAIVSIAALTLPLESAEMEIRIAKFKGDRGGAFSFTFDDGWAHQVENAVEALDPLDLKGTFFFMPLAMEASPKSHATWKRSRELQANGHEIGTHAKVAPKLHECSAEELENIINKGHALIESKTGHAPISFALPGGSQLTDAVRDVIYQRHAFVRKPNTYPDEAEVVAYGSVGKRKWKSENEQAKIQATIKNGKWRIAVIHAIVKGYAPFPNKAVFRQHCEWIKQQEDDLWIAPMGVVGRYVQARKLAKLQLHTQSKNSCSFTLRVPEELRAQLTEPLTIVVPIEGRVVEAEAKTERATLPVQIKDQHILLDVPVQSGMLTLTWK